MFFCKVVKQLVKLWRKDGLAVLSFVDDQSGGAAGFVASVRARNRMLRDNEYYGFTVADKSAPLPMQRLLFLGFVEHMACPCPTFHVPRHKMEMLRTLAQGTIDDIAPGSVPPVPPPTCSGRLVVDVCCGVCSVGYAHFLEDPAVRILAIDILSEHVFWAAIPAELHPRVRYIQEDMIRLTVDRLDVLLREQWNAKVEDVDHRHGSPMCDSMSRASRGKGRHRDRQGNPRSRKARQHDARLRVLLRLVQDIVARNEHVHVSLENPWNFVFPRLVAGVAVQPGWRFIERADHCVMADRTDRRAFPQKPSSWLVYGVVPDDDFPVCNRSGRFRLGPRSHFHRRLVCRRVSMVPGQRVIQSVRDKSRLPYGAVHKLWASHCRWRVAQAQRAVTAGAGALDGAVAANKVHREAAAQIGQDLSAAAVGDAGMTVGAHGTGCADMAVPERSMWRELQERERRWRAQVAEPSREASLWRRVPMRTIAKVVGRCRWGWLWLRRGLCAGTCAALCTRTTSSTGMGWSRPAQRRWLS